jgi:iron complex outermembrane receptor protein
LLRPLGLAALVTTAQAQPAAAPAPAASAASAPAQRVEITGGRLSDEEARRRSTAAKIVIGREEIEKFGDATVGEVLRRLPGVTTPGAPGRGGAPRLRGLGSGYTQLLIDGQRVPPGFSLESLTPEQIERIEILRAPTAETGARAIGGTINIVTREGFRRRLNDLRPGLALENGQLTPGMFWTHNDSAGDLTYNLSGAVFRPWRDQSSRIDTTVSDPLTGALRSDASEVSTNRERRKGLHATARLQWRLGEQGDMLMLAPSLFHNEGVGQRESGVTQRLPVPVPGQVLTQPEYDRAQTSSLSHSTSARLNLQWRQRMGIGRLELHGGLGNFESASSSRRETFGGQGPHVGEERTRTQDRSANLTAKLSALLGGRADGSGEHSLVTGLELEAHKRDETRSSTLDGTPLLLEFGEQLSATSMRLALYGQDEWALDKHWALHAGLRWEGIVTRGEAEAGVRPENRSSVATPLVHVLWKPDPAKRDQLRLSLTRSYRAPSLATLIARPSLNARAPVPGGNDPSTPDSAGNPDLKPELARGIDLAFERYLEGGGVLSANLFYRRIQDLMRRVVALETVGWAPVPRWVARQQNIGDATTQGLELEAKFRLDQAVQAAPPVELRSNLSLYRSRVEGVPGPDNRLDSQPKASANFGADYRLRGTPLTLGGNLNWVPAYRTQLSAEQAVTVSTKRVFDAYALWTFSPSVALRLLGSNLAPRDYRSTSVFEDLAQRTQASSISDTYTNWQLRLELKL